MNDRSMKDRATLSTSRRKKQSARAKGLKEGIGSHADGNVSMLTIDADGIEVNVGSFG